MNAALRCALDDLVNDLVDARYVKIEQDGRAGRLDAEQLRTAVHEFGRTLVPIPPDGWELVQEYPQADSPDEFALDVPLWTREEGRSDLTLSVTATRQLDRWMLVIDDLHVL